MLAAANGHAQCVRLLIDAGADKDAKDDVRGLYFTVFFLRLSIFSDQYLQKYQNLTSFLYFTCSKIIENVHSCHLSILVDFLIMSSVRQGH
jgi:hypothetical protein